MWAQIRRPRDSHPTRRERLERDSLRRTKVRLPVGKPRPTGFPAKAKVTKVAVSVDAGRRALVGRNCPAVPRWSYKGANRNKQLAALTYARRTPHQAPQRN